MKYIVRSYDIETGHVEDLESIDVPLFADGYAQHERAELIARGLQANAGSNDVYYVAEEF